MAISYLSASSGALKRMMAYTVSAAVFVDMLIGIANNNGEYMEQQESNTGAKAMTENAITVFFGDCPRNDFHDLIEQVLELIVPDLPTSVIQTCDGLAFEELLQTCPFDLIVVIPNNILHSDHLELSDRLNWALGLVAGQADCGRMPLILAPQHIREAAKILAARSNKPLLVVPIPCNYQLLRDAMLVAYQSRMAWHSQHTTTGECFRSILQ